MTPEVSIVLPARDEAGGIAALVAEIGAVLSTLPHEIIVVDDGSRDDTAAAVRALGQPGVRVLRHAASAGQSAAIRTGVRAARAPLVATLDADGQNPPTEILAVLAPFRAGPRPRLGLVQGQRAERRDGFAKRAASRIANRVRGGLLRDGVRDSGCGLKAFPRDVYLALAYFDHIHRFMAAMVRREGYDVEVVDVAHRARRSGVSKYGTLGRGVVGVVDLAGVAWLLRRRRLAEVEVEGPVGPEGLEPPTKAL